MIILILESQNKVNIDEVFAKRLIDSGKAVEVKAVVEEKSTTVITESKEQAVSVEQKTYKDSKGKKYTEEQVAKMDKRTGLYKEIMQLSK